jgi:hypothetical protein
MPVDIAEIERRLWRSADQLRANSGLRLSEYSRPVLGLLFLRYAEAIFADAQKALKPRPGSRLTPGHEPHIGDIRGALGTIRHCDIAPRRVWWPRSRTLLAILGPGLIVMVGDNDAGAFSTYTQAGQDYGTTPSSSPAGWCFGAF